MYIALYLLYLFELEFSTLYPTNKQHTHSKQENNLNHPQYIHFYKSTTLPPDDAVALFSLLPSPTFIPTNCRPAVLVSRHRTHGSHSSSNQAAENSKKSATQMVVIVISTAIRIQKDESGTTNAVTSEVQLATSVTMADLCSI